MIEHLFFILLMDLEINLFCNTINNGFCIIRADNFHTTNMVYLYQEMGGTLSHRSFSKNIIWIHAYNIFIFICSIYLFVVFLRDMERNFFSTFQEHFIQSCILIFLYFFVPYIYSLFFWGTWRETFFQLFKNIIWIHAYNIFIFIRSIYLFVVFLKDMERNLYEWICIFFK